jgi:hypothetical protein
VTTSGRVFVVILGGALVAPVSDLRSDSPNLRPAHVVERYLIHEPASAPVSYRAFRRLEAQGMGSSGWLEAWTNFDRGRFTYEITAEGGSDRVRERVLRKVLSSEQRSWASGEARRSGVTLDNYEFEPSEDQPRGLFKIRLKPRHKTNKLLIDGVAFLTPEGSRLVRVEGRLNGAPSFWISHVDVTRTYRPLAGANVLVEVGSRANLRFAGHGTFRMTYQYTHVNGRPVGVVNPFASGAPAE